jgi:DNA-binding MarR family transcriptional regulator
MTDEGLSDEEWRELASIRHSVRGTRKQDVLDAFPESERTTVSPSEIADELDMSLSNVSRELRKLGKMELVEDLTKDKPNYKPYAVTAKGLRVRQMLKENDNQGNDPR